MTVTNIGEFVADVNDFAGSVVPGAVVLFHKKISLQALEGVVNRTPVDTGRARGNWQLTTETPAEGELEVTDKDGGATIERGLAPLASLEPFGSVWIANNVPYIEVLENGHSQQAPNGMVGVTVTSLKQQFVGGE